LQIDQIKTEQWGTCVLTPGILIILLSRWPRKIPHIGIGRSKRHKAEILATLSSVDGTYRIGSRKGKMSDPMTYSHYLHWQCH